MIPHRLHASFLYSIFISSLILFALTSCAPAMEQPWEIAQVRALDPLDAPDPALDLIAVYTRAAGLEQHIRLDFLDMPETPAADIYIALDTQPGGAGMVHLSRLDTQALYPEGLLKTDIDYDLLLVIPAEGEPSVLDIAKATLSTRIKPRIIRDTALDTLTVVLSRFDLPANYSLQVFVTAPAEHAPADQSAAIASDALPPPRAPLVMAFSQAFPATTPAQTLRRWDGAHTGPYGERHGLHPLLDAAATNRIPLVLLDLKTPASLSALDLTGGMDQVKKMIRNRLLTLPDVIYGEPGDVSLTNSVNAAKAFGLPVGKFICGPDNPGADYPLQFFSEPQAVSPVSIVEWNGERLIGIPPAMEEQTTPDGLTLETRRMLINSALEGNIVILGGDLPDSAWGDSDAGLAGMSYIAAHPWIQSLDADALMNISPTVVQTDPRLTQESPSEPVAIYNSQRQPTGFDSTTLQKKLLSRLETAPDNALTDSAWEMYFLLTARVRDPQLAALNAQYLGDVNFLLTAADWANAPASQSTCSVDLNFDLLPDCVLADGQLFAVFQSDGARLSYLFSHDGKNVHQIVAPGWQFTTGLSDRTLWQTQVGSAADPSQIPGAFFDADSPWRLYTPLLNEDGSVTFSSSDGHVKTYRLVEEGVLLEYNGGPLTIKSGLALNPWRRFEPDWGKDYIATMETNSLKWQLKGGPSALIRVSGGKLSAFNDSAQFLSGPEDPNQDFPPGHYLPFPLAVMDFPMADGAQVLLKVK